MRTVQSNSPGGANVTRIKHTPVDIWTVLPSTGSGPVLSCFEYIDRWTCPSMSWTSLKLPLPVYDLDSKLIQGSFGSPLSTPEMASRSVQPFLHRYRQSPPMLYNGSLLFLLKIAWEIWTPSSTYFLGSIQVQIPDSWSWHTKRPHFSICNNRPHLRSTASQPNNTYINVWIQCFHATLVEVGSGLEMKTVSSSTPVFASKKFRCCTISIRHTACFIAIQHIIDNADTW